MTPSNDTPREPPPSLLHRHKRLIAASVPLVLLVAILVVQTGCTWKVTPPPPPREPATVFLSDYGRHSRLAIEMDEHQMVEYAFGDWRYYGLGERSLWRGAVALLTPTDSTLGRRILPLTEDAESFHTVAGSVRSTRLLVEKGRADELLVRLDARYRQAIETQVSNDWSDLAFVLDNRNYHLFRNSNHQVAQWLRELDCEVRGNPILSNFQVEEDQ